MARLHAIGKKAVATAASMTSFKLLVPDDENIVTKRDRKDGAVDYRWAELVTILAAYQETKISGEKAKTPGQEYIAMTVECKVAVDEDSVNKGKRIYARYMPKTEEFAADEQSFGTQRFINVASSLMPIAGFDFDEDGGITEEALNKMFPEKDSGETSELAGKRAYAEVVDSNGYDSAAKKVLAERRQDVEGFLPSE